MRPDKLLGLASELAESGWRVTRKEGHDGFVVRSPKHTHGDPEAELVYRGILADWWLCGFPSVWATNTRVQRLLRQEPVVTTLRAPWRAWLIQLPPHAGVLMPNETSDATEPLRQVIVHHNESRWAYVAFGESTMLTEYGAELVELARTSTFGDLSAEQHAFRDQTCRLILNATRGLYDVDGVHMARMERCTHLEEYRPQIPISDYWLFDEATEADSKEGFTGKWTKKTPPTNAAPTGSNSMN